MPQISKQIVKDLIATLDAYGCGAHHPDLLPLLDQPEGEPVAWKWELMPDSEHYKRRGAKAGVYLENPASLGIPINHPSYKWTKLYTHPAPFTLKDIVEKCAQICESRFRSLMSDNNITAGNEAHKCAAAVRHYGLTYPIAPITADMVTDEMVAAYRTTASSSKEAVMRIVNAYLGSKK
jgi:hypothetical protein